MNKNRYFKSGLRATIAVFSGLAGIAAFANLGQATDLWKGLSTCTTGTNCSALFINGTLNPYASDNSFAGAYVTKVFGIAGECLRLELFTPIPSNADLEMSVVAPGGSVFRNDDKGGAVCPLCPLVKVNNLPGTGWYTVVIHQFAGTAQYVDFTLAYGRYNVNNTANCTTPTGPLSVSSNRPKDPSLRPTSTEVGSE